MMEIDDETTAPKIAGTRRRSQVEWIPNVTGIPSGIKAVNLQPALLPRAESSQHVSQGPLPVINDNYERVVSLGKAVMSSEQAKTGLKGNVIMSSPCRPDSSTSKRLVIEDQCPIRDWLNRGIRISEPNQQVFTGSNS